MPTASSYGTAKAKMLGKGRSTAVLDSARVTPTATSQSRRTPRPGILTAVPQTKVSDRLEVPGIHREASVNKVTPVKASRSVGKSKGSSIFHERHSTNSPAVSHLNTPTRVSSLRNSDVMVKVCTPEIYTAVRFETPMRKNVASDLVHNPGVEKSNLVVAVRVRPQEKREEEDRGEKSVVVIKDTEVSVLTEYGQTHNFVYDHCFCSSNPQHKQFANQEKVYVNLAKPLLAKAFEGYNTCLFAYGQTGSGKSYSIMGNLNGDKTLGETTGIVPRFSCDLFRKVEQINRKASPSENASIRVQISYFEIYKEKIQDLLSTEKTSLRVREHPQSGPYVVDLSQHAVSSFEEVQRWLMVGNRQRATAATSANERSSRSHAIFTITLTQSYDEKVDGQSHEIRRESRINFIDLAGSERVASVNSTGERREEGLTINQSLLTLGRVITALAEQTFVPYRESVLTWLLKESLGGDSKTVMLATVSPSDDHLEETLSTLRYACQARTIVNTARISEDPNVRLIRDLRQQIEALKHNQAGVGAHRAGLRVSVEAVVSGSHSSTISDTSTQRITELEDEIAALRQRLDSVNQRMDESWRDKVVEAERRRRDAEEILGNYGLSADVDPQQPCLVNVNQDPLLSGTLIFALKTGANWIGRCTHSAAPPQIQVSGVLVEEQHGCIDCVDGVLTLRTFAETYVNGQLVSSALRLHHGDRIIIAGTHYFHLHNPKDVECPSKTSIHVPDYQTAYEELRNVQEQRLKAAVEEAQENTRRQLLSEMEHLRNEAALEMSLQKHSYEDEIASLNRALQLRALEVPDSPTVAPTPVAPAPSAFLSSLEEILQETERRLNLPPKSPKSIFQVQSMLNEANALCRRWKAPYSFSRKEALEEALETAVCVHDHQRRVMMKWNVDTMKRKLDAMRQAAEDGLPFPTDRIFDGDAGDQWQVEVDHFVATSIRERLEQIQKRQAAAEFSFSVTLDESRFSLDSSPHMDSHGGRRGSLAPRSPPLNAGALTADACRDWLAKAAPDSTLSSMLTATYRLQSLLAGADRSSRFAVGLTLQTHTLTVVLPDLVERTIASRQPPVDALLRHHWTERGSELRRKLQTAVGHILQSISLESVGLFNEWVQHASETTTLMTGLLSELGVVFQVEAPSSTEDLTPEAASSSYRAAQVRVHQSVLEVAEVARSKMAQLPEETSTESLSDVSGSGSFHTGWLIKACHDCVAQVQILLERSAALVAKSAGPLNESMAALHQHFHQRIDVLLRMSHTIETLLVHLENADLNEIKYHVAGLEVQTKAYTQHLELADTSGCGGGALLDGDLSFAASMVHKIVAERKRMTALRRGRDVNYRPLPARLLASPSRKRVLVHDDSAEMNASVSPQSPYDSGEDSAVDEDEDDDVHLSASVIERALRFQEPAKSSLKSSTRIVASRSVRFDVSDSPSASPSTVACKDLSTH